ncbi:hypothetical protein PJE062_5004 [Pseudovibrio sp. JE062]|nr:hypothetical protein PJE062_5004 [Pseudovibrio sp. JE062]
MVEVALYFKGGLFKLLGVFVCCVLLSGNRKGFRNCALEESFDVCSRF